MRRLVLSTTKITPDLFPHLYEEILRDWNPRISRDQWKTAFDGRWVGDEGHCGYALANEGKLVGMLGMLFSERRVSGQTQRFCNLHAWHVRPGHRSHSLVLMRPVLNLRDYIVTDFTPSPAVLAISQRLGFAPLDSDVVVMPCFSGKNPIDEEGICDLSTGDDRVVSSMAEEDQRIFHDHQGIDCRHALLRSAEDYCYIVYSEVVESRLGYCLIHYISNRSLFVKRHASIRSHLMRQSGRRFAVIEARMLGEARLPRSFRLKGKAKLYRGTTVSPNAIDSLYSDMTLFKHSPMPSVHQRLRSAVKQWIPSSVRPYIRLPAGKPQA